jgi:hypothetical protein
MRSTSVRMALTQIPSPPERGRGAHSERLTGRPGSPTEPPRRVRGNFGDTYTAGLILAVDGCRMLLSWERLVLAELVEN